MGVGVVVGGGGAGIGVFFALHREFFLNSINNAKIKQILLRRHYKAMNGLLTDQLLYPNEMDCMNEYCQYC